MPLPRGEHRPSLRYRFPRRHSRRKRRESEMAEGKHSGTCFCGAVAVEVTGEPAEMGYCHCGSCRSWSAGPVNAFSLWPTPQVRITKGADQLASYAKHPQSVRKWCKSCGG